MPYIQVNNANLYYEEHGSGPETIVFAHGLMWSGLLYEYQVAALKGHYRCITFDFRGQGKSQITQNGYDMDSLTGDAAAIIEKLQAAPCHFAGLSMGGFVGMRLAIRYPHLLKSLILLETSADPEPAEKINLYRLMALVTRLVGTRVAANKVMPIMFGEKFLNDPGRAELREKLKQRAISNNKKGIYRATKGVINRDSVCDQLEKINIPTLIIVGDQDAATPAVLRHKSAATTERYLKSLGLEETRVHLEDLCDMRKPVKDGAGEGAVESKNEQPVATQIINLQDHLEKRSRVVKEEMADKTVSETVSGGAEPPPDLLIF